MNIKKLNQAIEVLKDDVGEGLVSCDIFTVADGMSIAGHNPQPKASALFNQLTSNIMKTLKGARFPNLSKYYIMDLEGDHMVIILPLGDYRWGILVNSKKVQLGLLLSIAIPNSIEAFEEAL
ncbi:hypothetical protein MNB_SV-9-567 [hydrothermal vent metagenome]|uniref:Roadblock/LAMTOR2 domain-containing protein n=1 Tax=hydrothermal vent metagenome TaxID=652676 RepID=A0A1W1BF74_9ZZZZ